MSSGSAATRCRRVFVLSESTFSLPVQFPSLVVMLWVMPNSSIETGNIFLVGPMAAGKTSIGKQLARRLGRPFWDSDKVLQQRTGVDIPTIFEYEGEEGFRVRESAVIDELTRKQGIVLASGGGAVLSEQNRRWLTCRGAVIYLRVSVQTQLQRTARDRTRPLLQTDDPRARLEALNAQREPLYLEVARLILDSDRYGVHAIVSRIIERLHMKPPV